MSKNERMPMWLAVGISVVVGLPFGLWLGRFSLVLWVVFTVWAVYLALGGTPQTGVKVMHAYVGGAVSASLVQMFCIRLIGWMDFGPTFNPAAGPAFPVIPVFIAYFIGFCAAVWWMKFQKNWLVSSLAYFSGISLTLGCIFTQQGGGWVGGVRAADMAPFLVENQYLGVIGSLIVSLLSAFGGCCIAALSVWLNGAKAPAPAVEADAQ